MPERRRPGPRNALAALVLAPSPALAHGSVPGIEGFYRSLSVPLHEPALGLAALALLLVSIRDSPARFQAGWKPYLGGLALGLVAGRALAATLPLEPALLTLTLAAALLAALAGDRATLVALPLLPLFGLGIGAAALPDPGPARAMAFSAAGALLGAHLPLLVGGGAISVLRDHCDGPLAAGFLSTARRIAAAWLAAVALLLLAFLLRPAA